MQEIKYTTAIAELEYIDNVVHITFSNVNVTLEQAKLHIADFLREFDVVLPAPVLADISAQKSPMKEVRDYLGSIEAVQKIKAIAIVASSNLSKIAGNLYLMFSKPHVPTQVFVDKMEALAWLQKFK